MGKFYSIKGLENKFGRLNYFPYLCLVENKGGGTFTKRVDLKELLKIKNERKIFQLEGLLHTPIFKYGGKKDFHTRKI